MLRIFYNMLFAYLKKYVYARITRIGARRILKQQQQKETFFLCFYEPVIVGSR